MARMLPKNESQVPTCPVLSSEEEASWAWQVGTVAFGPAGAKAVQTLAEHQIVGGVLRKQKGSTGLGCDELGADVLQADDGEVVSDQLSMFSAALPIRRSNVSVPSQAPGEAVGLPHCGRGKERGRSVPTAAASLSVTMQVRCSQDAWPLTSTARYRLLSFPLGLVAYPAWAQAALRSLSKIVL